MLDDHYNFGKRKRLSNIYIRPEMFMFGKRISERISFAVRFFKNMHGTTSLVLGGEFSVEKLLFLQACFGYFQNICLVGNLGFSVAKWVTRYIPDTRNLQSGTDKVFRALFNLFRNNPDTKLHLPEDIKVILPPPPKEEVPVDPKAKKPQTKDEMPQEEATDIYSRLQRKAALTADDRRSMIDEAVVRQFRSFDIDGVEAWEAMQREDLVRMRKEEAERDERERLKREEEAAKDPKKKKEHAKGVTIKDIDKDKKIMAGLPEGGAEIEAKVSPYLEAMDNLFNNDMFPVAYGESTINKLHSLISNSDSVLWIDVCSVSSAYDTSLDKTSSKILRTRALQAAEMIPQADSDKPQLRIGVLGADLIALIDQFDLKDPPPPKQKKYITGEDGEEEAEEEEEGEEEDEDEDEFDEDDLSSAEIRRRRKKNNIDQITDLYSHDEKFFLNLMKGEYIEGKIASYRT